MNQAALSRPLEWLAQAASLDRPARALATVTARRHGPLVAAARGRPLGHPVHPAFTDLPIGFWTSATVLDLVGGRGSSNAARHLIGWGVLTALPTVATGLADAPTLSTRKQRVMAVHAAANLAATGGYAASWALRRRGRDTTGVLVGLGAAAVASVGGYLGGWLTMGQEPRPRRRSGGSAGDDRELAAEAVVEALAGRQVATAESCTAGRIASALATVPGAIDFFAGTLVGYQDEVKRDQLGVRAESVYSSQAVEEMVRGACRLFDVPAAVATSGVVGDEPEDGVAPGTVFIATAVDGVVNARRHRFDGAPEERCEQAATQALRDLALDLAAT